jgi:hypothetical protein
LSSIIDYFSLIDLSVLKLSSIFLSSIDGNDFFSLLPHISYSLPDESLSSESYLFLLLESEILFYLSDAYLLLASSNDLANLEIDTTFYNLVIYSFLYYPPTPLPTLLIDYYLGKC